MSYPKVSIIILNWNGKEDTIECIESLKHITYPNYEILLVDNGSTDGSIEFLRETYPYIDIIENAENLGFAEGNNVGIKHAVNNGAEYVLLLNNDTIVHPFFLIELINLIQHCPNIGICGPKIYYYNIGGVKNIINFAGGRISFFKGSTSHIALNQIDEGQYTSVKYVDYVEGSCMLIRSRLFDEIGFLDSDYFAYWEEADFCVRVSRAGYKIVCVHNAKIWHKIGSTTKRINLLYLYLMTRNRILFMKKNARLIFKITFIPFFIKDIAFSLLKVMIFERKLKAISDTSSIIYSAIFEPDKKELQIEKITRN